MRRLLLAALLLSSSSAFAQIETTPPSSAGSFTGGAVGSLALTTPSTLSWDGLFYFRTEGGGAISLTDAAGTTYRVFNAGILQVKSSSGTFFRADTNQVSLEPGEPIRWSGTSNDATAAKDVGIMRAAAGFLRIDDGTGVSSGNIGLRTGDGATTTPSLAWSSDADGTGTGLYRPAANEIGFTTNGANAAFVRSTGFLTGGDLRFCTGGSCAAADVGISRPAAGVARITDASSGRGRLEIADGTPGTNCAIGFTSGACITGTSSPAFDLGTTASGWLLLNSAGTLLSSSGGYLWSSGTIRAAGPDTGIARNAAGIVAVTQGSGTGATGALRLGNGSVSVPSLTFANGTSTGVFNETGVSAALNLVSAGSVREAMIPAKSVTDNTLTSIARVDVASNTTVGLQVQYEASVTTGGIQSIAGLATFNIINNAGTETCSAITETGEVSNVSTGTITFTLTCDTSPTNGVNLQVTIDSSLNNAASVSFTIRKVGGGTASVVSL